MTFPFSYYRKVHQIIKDSDIKYFYELRKVIFNNYPYLENFIDYSPVREHYKKYLCSKRISYIK